MITGNAAGPTSVCGPLATATWNNAGGPYNICSGGATIPFGATITIDGTGGAVQVHSLGGGLNVNGGVLQTANTSATNLVTFDANGTATPGAWPGLQFSADGSGNKGSGALAYTTISYASTGASINDGSAPVSGWGLSLNNVKIDHTASNGVTSYYTAVTVSASNFSQIAGVGVSFSGNANVNTSLQQLNVDSTSFSSVNTQAIMATTTTGQKVVVTGNTITAAGTANAGYPAIEVDNSDNMTVSNNTVTSSSLGTGTYGVKNPAILLSSDTANLGNVTGQASVFGNSGKSNAMDAIQLNSVTVKNSFSWLTPHPNVNATDALGYLVTSDLAVSANQTMTVGADDVVKLLSGSLRIAGAHLVVNGTSGHQAVFTSAKDGSFDTGKNVTVTCPSAITSTCVAAGGDWSGIAVTSVGTAGDTIMAQATIRYANVAISIGTAAASLTAPGTPPTTGWGLVLNNVTIDHASNYGVSASTTPISVSGSTFSNIGADAIMHNANIYAAATVQKLNVDTTTFTTVNNHAIVAAMGGGSFPAVVSGNTVSAAGTANSGYPAIQIDGTDTLTVSNNTVTGSSDGTGLYGERNPVMVLSNATVNLANVTGQPSVFGNTGKGNALDAIQLSNLTVKTSFSWQTPHRNANATDALGYVVTSELKLNNAGATMTVGPDDVVKMLSGSLTLTGAHLVVNGTSGHQAVFTSVRDGSFDAARNLTVTCPSSFASTCGPAAGDWTGINLTSGGGDAAITQAVIRYTGTGLNVSSGAASLPGGWGASLTNVTIDHTSYYGVNASVTPISVSGSTFTNIGGDAINHNTNFYANSSIQKLNVDTTTFTTVNNHAIVASMLSGVAAVVTGNTITAAGTANSGSPAIEVSNADNLTVSNNTVSGSGAGTGTYGTRYPAIYLSSDTINLGNITGQASVYGNTGKGNAMDAIQLNGLTVKNSFSWQTPHPNANATDALGYVATSDLTLSPNQTMTVGADDVVKLLSGSLRLPGAHLVVNGTSGHQAVFTSIKDGSFDSAKNVTVTCPSSIASTCSAAASDWSGISATLASGTAGDATLTQATIRYPGTGINIGDGANSLTGPGTPPSTGWGVVLVNVVIDHTSSAGLTSTYTPATVSGSTFSNIGSDAINHNVNTSTNSSFQKLTVDSSTFTAVNNHAIVASMVNGVPAVVTGNTVSGAGTANAGSAAIEVDNTDAVTVSNNTVTGSGLGTGPYAARYPAIYLSNDTVNLANVSGEPSVFGNTGKSNAMDAIHLTNVTVKNSFSWQTPHPNANATDPLGYVVSSDLALSANKTMTVGADDVVKMYGGSLKVAGAHLVVNGTSGHQAVFTSARDGSFDAAKNVTVTCPSSITSTCVTSGGDWNGINITSATVAGLPVAGDAAITQAAIRYPSTALNITDGATSLTGGWGLTLATVTIDHALSYGVYASSTATLVSGSSISSISGTAVYFTGSAPVQKLTVDSTSFNTSGTQAIMAQVTSGVPVALTNNTVVGAGTTGTYGGPAIEVGNADNLALNGNKVSGSGTGQNGNKNPAIRLTNDTVNLSNVNGQPSVYNNTGHGNGLDAFELYNVVDKSSFGWQTPHANATDTDALGYLVNGDLTIGPSATLTFAPSDVVKVLSGRINLNGGHLFDTAGGTVFTSIRDSSFDASKGSLTACPSAIVPTCVVNPGDWGGIAIGSAMVNGLPVLGDGTINGATIREGTTGVSISSASTALAGGVGLLVSGSVFENNLSNGIYVQPGASGAISTSRFTGNGGTSDYALRTNGPVTAECDSIHGNGQGFYSATAGSSYTQGDLYGNSGPSRYDITVYNPTPATNNWWGQASGPAASQVAPTGTPDTSNFVTSQAPIVTIGLIDSNTSAGGAFGKGTLTVTLTFSRKMDTSVAPTVTIDPGAHPVSGTWQSDAKTWIGTYAADSTNTTAGQDTVNVSNARSCVPEPTTNQMAPTSRTFSSDFGTATVTTGPATAVADTAATLNGTINPNGWATNGYFEYGTTSGTYGTHTATQAIGNGTSAVAITQGLTGLTPFTTYYYKTVASSANGIAEGNEQSFVTPSILHFPALMNNAFGGYTTTVYIQNKSDHPLDPGAIKLNYYNTSGASVGSGDTSPALVVGGVWLVRQDNGNSFPAGSAGSAVVNTNVPIVAFTNQEIGAGDGSSYSALPDPATGSTVFAPSIMNYAYGGYTTGIDITNTGKQQTTVTVTYHNPDGSAIATTRSNSLAPNAFWGLYQGESGTPLPSGFAGTATITTSPASNLAVTVNNTNPINGQFLTYTASNVGATRLYAPAVFNNAYGGYSTGMGIQNLGTSPANVTIDYTGNVGSGAMTSYRETLTVAAGGSNGHYNGGGAGHLLPDGFHGSAVITSDQPLVETVNQTMNGASYGTSYNTVASGVPVIHLPLVENNINGFTTGVIAENVGSGPATVTIVYYNPDDGTQVSTGPTLTLLPGEFAGVYQGGTSSGVPNGTRATATLTVTNPGSGGKLAVIVNQVSGSSFMSYAGQ